MAVTHEPEDDQVRTALRACGVVLLAVLTGCGSGAGSGGSAGPGDAPALPGDVPESVVDLGPADLDPTAAPVASSARPLPTGAALTVDRLIDGDTLVVAGRTVRLIGIDTPEGGTACLAREAAGR